MFFGIAKEYNRSEHERSLVCPDSFGESVELLAGVLFLLAGLLPRSGLALKNVLVAAFFLGFVVGVDEVGPHIAGAAGLRLYLFFRGKHPGGLAAVELFLGVAVGPHALHRQSLQRLLAA